VRYPADRAHLTREFDDNIDLAFAKRLFEPGQKADLLGEQFLGLRNRGANEKVDIATALGVIHTGTEKQDRNVQPELLSGCGENSGSID